MSSPATATKEAKTKIQDSESGGVLKNEEGVGVFPEGENTFPVNREYGRSVSVPRMSRQLRFLLEEIAEYYFENGQSSSEHLCLPSEPLEIEDGSTVEWDNGGGEMYFSSSKMQSVLGSLLSHGYGEVLINGLEDVRWRLSVEETRSILLEEKVIKPSNGSGKQKGSELQITKDGIRKRWTEGVREVVKKADSSRVMLTERGQKVAADLWAWRRAKEVGVSLSRARENETLPSRYLSKRERRNPGRFRTRGLYKEVVSGTTYSKKKGMIFQGDPPDLEDKHKDSDGKIGEFLSDVMIHPGTIFGQGAKPIKYISQRDSSMHRVNTYIEVEGGDLVNVQDALFLLKRYPNGEWVTGQYEATANEGFGDESKEVSKRFIFVVDEEGDILASLAPYKNKKASEVKSGKV